MFTGLTVTGLLTDAEAIATMFSVPITVAAVFWAGRRLIYVAKAFFGG